jgi:hypothetical protein
MPPGTRLLLPCCPHPRAPLPPVRRGELGPLWYRPEKSVDPVQSERHDREAAAYSARSGGKRRVVTTVAAVRDLPVLGNAPAMLPALNCFG